MRAATRENALSRDQLARMGITAAAITESLAAGTTRGWVCLRDSRIVGFCMGDSARGEVLVLALLPDHERQGIGKALLSRVVDWLRSFDPPRIWLGTSPNPDTRAYGFYRALGWRPTGRDRRPRRRGPRAVAAYALISSTSASASPPPPRPPTSPASHPRPPGARSRPTAAIGIQQLAVFWSTSFIVLLGGRDRRARAPGAGSGRVRRGPAPAPSLGLRDRPGVVCLSYAALALWQLGRPRQAQDRSHEALSLARDLSHPQSLALALVWGAWLRQFRREPQPAREHAETAAALCAEQGFPLWLSMAVILQGWALAEEGQEEEGIARMRPGSGRPAGHGRRALATVFLALLAKAHGKVGRVEDGLGMLDEALAMTSRNGERAHEAELHRVRGELLLLAGGAADEPGRKLASARRSRSLAGRRQGRSSFAPRPRWPASMPAAAAAPRPTTCSPRSSAGSPRASVPQTSRRRRPSSRSCQVLIGHVSSQASSNGLETERRPFLATSGEYTRRGWHVRVPH